MVNGLDVSKIGMRKEKKIVYSKESDVLPKSIVERKKAIAVL